MVSENFDIEFQSRFDELMKARSGYYKDNSTNRHLGRVGVPYGSKRELYDVDFEKNNDLFNETLDRYQKGTMKNNERFHLGFPGHILKHFLPYLPIDMMQNVVTKGVKVKHNLKIDDLKNLPYLINHPIFLFQRATDKISFLTEAKNKEGKNIFLAIEMNKTIQDGKKFYSINSVLTVHEREFENVIEPLLENDTLRWVDKKKGLNWISSVQSNGQELSNSNLSKLKELINKTSLSLPKGTTNMNDMQQFVDEIIEKSKKGAPIGTERTWGGKVYIKANLVELRYLYS